MALVEAIPDLLGTPNGLDVGADLLSLGLDSIVALSVVQAARRRGIALRARLMLECGTIRELAAAIDLEAITASRPEMPSHHHDSADAIPVLPNAHWLYQYGDPRRLAQTEVIQLPDGITGAELRTMLAAVVDGHEVLRSGWTARP